MTKARDIADIDQQLASTDSPTFAATTLTGRLTLPTATYHYSSDGKARLYYYDLGDTMFRTADDFLFRNNANATVAQISGTGTVTATSFIGDGSDLTNAQSPLLHLRQEETAGTTGGALATGAFRKRVLNTVKTNEITGASLSSGVITLPAGTYFIDVDHAAYATGITVGRLQNTSDSTTTIVGLVTRFISGNGGTMQFSGRFTIASSKTFEVQQRGTTTFATDDGGLPHGWQTECYVDVKIWEII